jgi:hypothetical protein
MRSIISFALLVSSLAVQAQQDVFSNKTNVALEKVIKDFPNRFKNIKGELLAQHTQTAEYRSTIQVPGSSSCVVRHTQASNNDAYSWTCTAFENKDFNLARLKFKEIFEQIENTIIKIDGEKPFIVSGQYKNPQEERKSTIIVFDLLPAVGDMKRLKVELALQNAMSNWKVDINVYDNAARDEQSTAAN